MTRDSSRRAYRPPHRGLLGLGGLLSLATALCLPLAGTAAWSSDAVTALKKTRVFARCEAYYQTVERYKTKARHYLIKDASVAFVEELKSMQPASEQESFLHMECLNLANGNAVFAFEEIIRLEAEDDDFIEMAFIDATNNANAAQFEYMAEAERNHLLATDMELAFETYENMIVDARKMAAQRANSSFGLGLSSNADVSIYSGAYNAGFAFLHFAELAVLAFQHYLMPNGIGGGGGGVSNGSIPANRTAPTLAPPSRPKAASRPAGSGSGGGSTANQASGGATKMAGTPASTAAAQDPDAEPTAGEETSTLALHTPREAAVPALSVAPKLDPHCADYHITREDVAFAEVTNVCRVPISFFWCWVEDGRQSCTPSYLSEVVRPGETVEIAGPAATQTRVAKFAVCDMGNPDLICKP